MTVLAGLGGGGGPRYSNMKEFVTVAEIYDPRQPIGQRWKTVGDTQIPRLYHSVAFLTPNAEVQLCVHSLFPHCCTVLFLCSSANAHLCAAYSEGCQQQTAAVWALSSDSSAHASLLAQFLISFVWAAPRIRGSYLVCCISRDRVIAFLVLTKELRVHRC